MKSVGIVAFPSLFLAILYFAANAYTFPLHDLLETPTAQKWLRMNTSSRISPPTDSSRKRSTIAASNGIECYRESPRITPVETTFETCKKIWQGQIRRFPKFYEVQEFRVGVRPRIRQEYPLSGKPPFLFVNDDPPSNDCAICVDPTDPQESDWFSWAQVKDAAQQVMDVDGCGSPSGGGRIPVGRGQSWRVRVYGYNKDTLARAANQSTERFLPIGNRTLTNLVACAKTMDILSIA